MALVHNNFTVGTTATLIVDVPEGVSYTAVQICNTHNQPIWLGGSSVTSTGANVGIQLGAGATIQTWLHANDKLYAVSVAPTTANAISVVYSGV